MCLVEAGSLLTLYKHLLLHFSRFFRSSDSWPSKFTSVPLFPLSLSSSSFCPSYELLHISCNRTSLLLCLSAQYSKENYMLMDWSPYKFSFYIIWTPNTLYLSLCISLFGSLSLALIISKVCVLSKSAI